MLVISILRRLRQEDQEFKTNLGYIVRLSQNNRQTNQDCVGVLELTVVLILNFILNCK
jgi:hypothetical protein